MSQERDRVTEIETIYVSSLQEAVRHIPPQGIGLIDSDFTLRRCEYSKLLRSLQLGKIPEESMRILDQLNSEGTLSPIISNQPLNGHQIARFLGTHTWPRHKTYPYFPDSIQNIVGENAVFGGGRLFFLPWNHYKRTDKSVADIHQFVLNHINNACHRIVFIGDKKSDGEFAIRLNKRLWYLNLKVDKFIKLPDPDYLEYLDCLKEPVKSIFKGILSRLVP